MSAGIIILKCLTNMHVGNGDVNYNIIDNEVERDPVNNYPTINSSGVKGALRQFFVNNCLGNIDDIFGSDRPGNNTQGKVSFLSADMVSIPFRATEGEAAYYQLTTMSAVQNLKEKYELFLKKSLRCKESNVSSGCSAENIKLSKTLKIDEIADDIYIVAEADFRSLCLPVIARNYLENGISKNLWYEEVVPHGSVFAFAVLTDTANDDKLQLFERAVDGKIIQFGGNASIGYGLCKVTVISPANLKAKGDGNE